MNIPFYSLSYTNNIIQNELKSAFEKVLFSNSLILGENVSSFEQNFSKHLNVKHTVGVSSGLDALKISLKSLGIKKGDEVIVPSNTYIATWFSISLLGATPIPVEPCLDSFNIDISKIEEKITKKTKAIIPVHMYGNPCEIDKIIDLANQYNLFVIEDFAQAQGAKYKDKALGSWGHINATSFYPSKNLGALGDAGGICTNEFSLYKKCSLLRNYGSNKKYYNEIIGFNNRLDELQATFLNVKLKYLDEWNLERRRIAENYNKKLNHIPQIELPVSSPQAHHVFHLYVIKTSKRNELQSYLFENGVQTLIHYPISPHLQMAYTNLKYKKGDFPLADKLSDEILSLPLYNGMTYVEQVYVCEQIFNYFKDIGLF
jgi:dTDP-4-amino-4,6-dideoxygalactose transaminase